MHGGVLMGLEKPTSIVAMLRIFFLPITAKGGCAHLYLESSDTTIVDLNNKEVLIDLIDLIDHYSNHFFQSL